MKKLITILMALTLVGGILAGCSNDAAKPDDKTMTPAADAPPAK